MPLFPNIKVEEAIVLQNKETQQEVLLTHGHQADFMNYAGWKFNRFFIRTLNAQLVLQKRYYTKKICGNYKTKKKLRISNGFFGVYIILIIKYNKGKKTKSIFI